MGLFRPVNAILTPGHPLWTGCNLALLGQHAGGVTAYDSSPYGNDGTLTNMDPATDWQPDANWNRYRLDFDGSNDYVTIPAACHSWIGTGDFTVSVRVSAISNAGVYLIMGTGGYGDANRWHLRCHSSFWRFIFENQTVGFTAASYEVPNHFVLTRKSDTYKVYCNGVDDTGTDQASGDGLNLNYNGPLLLGKIATNLSSVHSQSDIGLWNRVISTAEIKKLASPDPMLDGALWVPSSTLTFWTGGGAPPASIIPQVMHHRRLLGVS